MNEDQCRGVSSWSWSRLLCLTESVRQSQILRLLRESRLICLRAESRGQYRKPENLRLILQTKIMTGCLIAHPPPSHTECTAAVDTFYRGQWSDPSCCCL